jgi:hypothetical protein
MRVLRRGDRLIVELCSSRLARSKQRIHFRRSPSGYTQYLAHNLNCLWRKRLGIQHLRPKIALPLELPSGKYQLLSWGKFDLPALGTVGGPRVAIAPAFDHGNVKPMVNAIAAVGIIGVRGAGMGGRNQERGDRPHANQTE